MKSYVPLDWSSQEATTQQLGGRKSKQFEERQLLKKIYEETVDKRLHRRYPGYVQSDLRESRNEDILSREVEQFNQSKVSSGGASRMALETRDMGLQCQPFETTDNPTGSNARSTNAQPISLQQKQTNFTPSNQPHYQHYSNPEIAQRQNSRITPKRYEQDHRYKLPQQNYSYVEDRYRSLDAQRSPYPRQDLSKLVEQLYTGSKVQEYPFRNVMPDKLEYHLRQKTKADRKRAYHVTLNLFKH